MSTQSFYENLSPLENLNEALEGRGFSQLPEDWAVIICDVKGSTNAVEKGQYKNVNFAGATPITAVLNKVSHLQVPYVFGGDGATILIHSSHLAVIVSALTSTQKFVRETFELDLRVCIYPYKKLLEKGKTIRVAKLRKGSCCFQAMLMGEGIIECERIAKSTSDLFINACDHSPAMMPHNSIPAPLDGLSCRWQPLLNQKGQILSLIVLSQSATNCQAILEDVYGKINKIIPNISARSPVDKNSLKYSLIPQGWKLEWKRDSKNLPKIFFLISIFFRVLFLKIVFAIRPQKLFGFPVERYYNELLKQNDFIKLEEGLKMVIDCSPDEAEKIEESLIKLYSERKIFYGLHRAGSATMTCLVLKPEVGDHIHFLDGTNGGYTNAAKKLKEQLKLRIS